MTKQNCYVEFHGFNFKTLNQTVNKIIEFLNNFEYINVRGPINLPIKKKKLTLLRSPHVHKKSQEHFETFNYKSFIVIETEHLQVLLKIINYIKQNMFLNLQCRITTTINYKY